MAEWLEHMPRIPFGRAVPVIDDDNMRWTVTGPSPRGHGWWVGTASLVAHQSTLRVDLGDPQGFAYALRYAWKRGFRHAGLGSSGGALLTGWRDDMTTDEDRLALAKALKEVTP